MKKPGKDATDVQASELKAWSMSGAKVTVAHSVAEVKAFMAEAFHVNDPTKGARDE